MNTQNEVIIAIANAIANANNAKKDDEFKNKTIPRAIPREIPIPISKEKTTIQYSLCESFFDPSQKTPPNDFMLKLTQRLQVYNSYTRHV
jgi:hypothetical protein